MNKFKKSNKNRVFFGVCGGLAESLGLDVSVVRLGFVAGAIFSGSILLAISPTGSIRCILF